MTDERIGELRAKWNKIAANVERDREYQQWLKLPIWKRYEGEQDNWAGDPFEQERE